MTSWPLVRLDQLLGSLESGSRPPGGAAKGAGGIASLGGEHLDADGGFRLGQLKYIPLSHFKAMDRGTIAPWDILLVKDGATTGKVSLVRPDRFPLEQAAVNEHVFLLRVKRNVADPAYIFYFLFSPRGQAEILRDHRGATVGGISRNFASLVQIPLPPLDQQSRIVDLLDQADRLRRLRATADAKADRILRALFLRMFGDPETNPMDWPMRRIADVCEVVTGATPKTGREEYWGGPVTWATPRDLSRLEDWVLDRTERTLTEAGMKSCATTMLPAGSVLLSSRAPIGLVAISGTPLCTNQGFKSLVCGADIDPWYLFAWCRLRTSFLQSLGHGATFKEISKRIVSDVPIALPPLTVQQDFRARIESLRNFRNQARIAGRRTNDLFRQLLTRAFSAPLPKDPPTC